MASRLQWIRRYWNDIYTKKRRAIPFYGMTPRQQATK
jgi:hypothetical protein